MGLGRRWMLEAPELPETRAGAVRERWAVLINPFYPKDTHASFGKHVLTPTLALTSVAAATPAGWRVTIRDENLLQAGTLPGAGRRKECRRWWGSRCISRLRGGRMRWRRGLGRGERL